MPGPIFVPGNSPVRSPDQRLSIEELLSNLQKYGVGTPTPAALAQVKMNADAMREQSGPAGYVGEAPLADRSLHEMNANPSTASAGMSPFEALMAQAMAGMSKKAQRSAVAPQRAAIKALQQAYAQAGAQTDQEVADIGSWFGQTAAMAQHNAKSDTRASKKAGKRTQRLGTGLLKGIADPNVARAVAARAQREGSSIARAGNEQAHFDRVHAADIAEQGDYQALVRQRLGMQAQSDIMSQIAQAKAAKSAAKAEVSSGAQSAMMDVIQMLPEDARLEYLRTGQLPAGMGDAPSRSDVRADASALTGALGRVPVFESDAQGGMPISDFQGILKQMYGAAQAQHIDINDPQIREQIRAWVMSNIAPTYNQKAGTNYHLTGPHSGFVQ